MLPNVRSVVRCRRISMLTQHRRFPVLGKVCELGRPAYQVLLELKFQGQLDRTGATNLIQRAEAAIRTAGAEAARQCFRNRRFYFSDPTGTQCRPRPKTR